MGCPKKLYAVELDITREAIQQGYRIPKDGYWVLHHDIDSELPYVYSKYSEAKELAKMCDHDTRIITYIRSEKK